MRRPVVSAPRLALDWVAEIGRQRGVTFEVDLRYPEGKWGGAGEPMFYLSGPLSQLHDLETLMLQKLGPSCVAAYNTYTICADLPQAAFLATPPATSPATEMAEPM